ncbi:hypothetical protein GYB22_00965 [bacterium]|nr:hypothetical protein [bacterium]
MRLKPQLYRLFLDPSTFAALFLIYFRPLEGVFIVIVAYYYFIQAYYFEMGVSESKVTFFYYFRLWNREFSFDIIDIESLKYIDDRVHYMGKGFEVTTKEIFNNKQKFPTYFFFKKKNIYQFISEHNIEYVIIKK